MKITNMIPNNLSTILIVDDNKTNLQVLGSILHKSNYKIAVAKDGESALKIANKTLPDLILLDIMMPEMDGFEVCEQLKLNDKTREIPVIFLSAKTESKDIVEGFVKGGIDFISKPFNKEELLIRIKTHIELKHSKDIIRNQAEELKAMNASKDQMFSIIGHDLRNSVGGLKSLLDYFTPEQLFSSDNSMQDMLKFARQTASSTFYLLENLLYWAKSQQNKLSVEFEEFKLETIIDETITLLTIHAENKKIKLHKKIDSDLLVIADKNMFNTIIRNLISNAIKFTNAMGKITIIAIRKKAFIEISVTDTGIGISTKDQEKILKSNLSYTTLGTENERGSGLGLSLCKEFVEKNGGTMSLTSEIGKGSTFKFTMKAGGELITKRLLSL